MEPHFRSSKSGLNRLCCVRQKQPFKPQLGVSKIQYEVDPAHQWKCPEKFKQGRWPWNDARIKEVTAMRNTAAVTFVEYLVHTLIVNLSLVSLLFLRQTAPGCSCRRQQSDARAQHNEAQSAEGRGQPEEGRTCLLSFTVLALLALCLPLLRADDGVGIRVG